MLKYIQINGSDIMYCEHFPLTYTMVTYEFCKILQKSPKITGDVVCTICLCTFSFDAPF